MSYWDLVENRRGRFTEIGDEGYEGLFHALDRAIELMVDDENIRNAISDTYRHLTADCTPESCELCDYYQKGTSP